MLRMVDCYSFFHLLVLLMLQFCVADNIDISFTPTKMFVDISEYTFVTDWQNVSQDFTITARAGRQVSLYIFSSVNDNKYNLSVYDGANDKSPLIPTTIMKTTNDSLLNVPMNITSTGQTMFLRVSSVGDYPGFYAIVTDYVRQVGCRPPVLSMANYQIFYANYNFEQNANGDCYYMIHALQQAMTDKFNLISTAKQFNQINVYKGLQTDNQHLLQSTDQMSYLWTFEQNLVIYPKMTVSLDLGLFQQGGLDHTMSVTKEIVNNIMTVDYLYDPVYPYFDGDLQSLIVLELKPPVTSVNVNFLNLLGSSSLIVTAVTNGSPVGKPITYLATNFKNSFNVTYTCDEVHLIYKTTGLTVNSTSGFYGMYSDATVYAQKTTPTPLQTATKGASITTRVTVILFVFVKYLATNFKNSFNVTYTCDEVHLIYKTTGLTVNSTSGFYGMYSDATVYAQKTTPTPLQTATKGASITTRVTVILFVFVKYII